MIWKWGVCSTSKGEMRWGQFHQSVYTQLLRVQIPKAKKDSQLKQLFVLSVSVGIKAACKNIDEIKPRWGQLHQPIVAKHKCTSTRSLAPKMTFSFTNKTAPNVNNLHNSMLCSTFEIYTLHCVPERTV